MRGLIPFLVIVLFNILGIILPSPWNNMFFGMAVVISFGNLLSLTKGLRQNNHTYKGRLLVDNEVFNFGFDNTFNFSFLKRFSGVTVKDLIVVAFIAGVAKEKTNSFESKEPSNPTYKASLNLWIQDLNLEIPLMMSKETTPVPHDIRRDVIQYFGVFRHENEGLIWEGQITAISIQYPKKRKFFKKPSFKKIAWESLVPNFNPLPSPTV